MIALTTIKESVLACFESKKRLIRHVSLLTRYHQQRLTHLFKERPYVYQVSKAHLIVFNRIARLARYQVTYYDGNQISHIDSVDVTYGTHKNHLFIDMLIEDFKRIAHGLDLYGDKINDQRHDLPIGIYKKGKYYQLISRDLPKGKTKIKLGFSRNAFFSCDYHIPNHFFHFHEQYKKHEHKKRDYLKGIKLQRKREQSSSRNRY